MRIAVLGTGMVGNAITFELVKDPGCVPWGVQGTPHVNIHVVRGT
jgi:predicted dinucleotide-binding enzyme